MMLWLIGGLLLAGAFAAARLLRTSANPVTFFSLGLAAPICARAVIDSTNLDWESIVGLCVRSSVSMQGYDNVLYIVVGGWLAFCLPWMFMFLRQRGGIARPAEAPPSWQAGFAVRNWLPAATLLLVAYVSFHLGYLPLWQMFRGILDVRILDVRLHELPLGIMAMITVMTMVYALDTSDNLLSADRKLRRFEKAAAIVLLLLLSMWNGKRQLLLFALFIYAANYLYRWDRVPEFRGGRRSPYLVVPLLAIALTANFVLIDHLRYSAGWSRPLSFIAYLSWPASNLLSMGEALGLGRFDSFRAHSLAPAGTIGDGNSVPQKINCSGLAVANPPGFYLPELVVPDVKQSEPVAPKPAPVVQKSASIVQTPALVATEPAPAVQKSVPDSPAPTVQKPVPIADVPVPAVQEPAPVAKKPSTAAQKPVPVAQEPAPIVQKPALVVTEPVPVQKPAPVAQEPAPVIANQTVADMSRYLGANREVPFVLTELLPYRFGGKENLKAIRPVLHEPSSPSGFFANWWLDGGLPFVLVGGFSFGVLSLWIYRRRADSHAYWQSYLLVLWASATSGIYEHFIALVYFWLPLALVFGRSVFQRVRSA